MELKRITDRAKIGRGLSPKHEPKWYYIMNKYLQKLTRRFHCIQKLSICYSHRKATKVN